MHFEYPHSLPDAEVRARIEALGDYLSNRHKIAVTWDGDRAIFQGKFKRLVKIAGEMRLQSGMIEFAGKDPGRVWRGQAVKYLRDKLDTYLDPSTPVDRLPRS